MFDRMRKKIYFICCVFLLLSLFACSDNSELCEMVKAEENEIINTYNQCETDENCTMALGVFQGIKCTCHCGFSVNKMFVEEFKKEMRELHEEKCPSTNCYEGNGTCPAINYPLRCNQEKRCL